MRSRQALLSISGVEVWFRTNRRAWSVRYRSGSTESQRISALVPKSKNWSAGVGLRIAGYAACAAGAKRVVATSAPLATEAPMTERRVSPARAEDDMQRRYYSESRDFIY